MKVGLIDVDGYDGKYKIRSDGQVISMYRNSNIHGTLMKVGKPKLLKQGIDKRGYCIVNLYDGKGNHESKKVHRLVAEAFLPNPDGKRCVCHRDNDPSNNRVENLYWGTDQENQDQAWADGLHKSEQPVMQCDRNGVCVGTNTERGDACTSCGGICTDHPHKTNQVL